MDLASLAAEITAKVGHLGFSVRHHGHVWICHEALPHEAAGDCDLVFVNSKEDVAKVCLAEEGYEEEMRIRKKWKRSEWLEALRWSLKHGPAARNHDFQAMLLLNALETISSPIEEAKPLGEA